jgi:hypothetical protein
MQQYPYNDAIPQASQKISSTQKPILNNFQSILELLSVNHVPFSSSDAGKHNFTSLQIQGSDASTSATQMAVYCKATPSGPNSAEIFYRYPSNGAIEQLTGNVGSGTFTDGYAYLATTVLMKWGTATGITTGANVITFPTTNGNPAFTTTPSEIYFSAATPYTQASGNSYISSSNNLQFTLQVGTSGFPTSIFWMAIGS